MQQYRSALPRWLDRWALVIGAVAVAVAGLAASTSTLGARHPVSFWLGAGALLFLLLARVLRVLRPDWPEPDR